MTKVYFSPQNTYDVEQIKDKIENGIKALEIKENFISNSDKVLIKPNMALGKHYSAQICTHPAVIKAVCEILSDYGAKIIIGDSPGFGTFISSAEKSGYNDFLSNYEKVDFKKKVKIKNESNKIYRSFNVANHVVEADKIINIAKFKAHGSMLLTLSVKNMFGAIIGMEKAELHLKAAKDDLMFASYLIELFYTINPDLNIIDAITAMEGNGPTAGTPKDLGYIAMSEDGTALDAVACKTVNFPYEKLQTYIAAKNLGYGTTNVNEIECLGVQVEDITVKDFEFSVEPDNDYMRLVKFFGKILPIKPKILHKKCKMCQYCRQICPVKTIFVEKGKMYINYSDCIHCFCCQEFCQYNAIKLKKPLLRKILSGMFSVFKR